MRIRLSVIVVALLGLAAAVAAAMLTASLQTKPLAEARRLIEPEAKILVASKDVPAMTILEQALIEERTVPADEAPKGSVAEAVQAVGKLLTVPVVAGQPLTQNLFAPEGSGLHVSGILPEGMRAVTIALSDYSGLEGLLYPGSRVDVLGSFPLKGPNKEGSAVSTALLENVQVLAVGHQAVGSPEEQDAEKASKSKGLNRKILVTLMVDANQAEALQLAMEHGQISLALRNPKDELKGDQDATLLSEGRLAQLAQLLDPTTQAQKPDQKDEPKVESAPAPAPVPAPEPQPPAPRKARPEVPQVTINVIRGVATETVTLPCPQSMR